jgi:hypothetical protein
MHTLGLDIAGRDEQAQGYTRALELLATQAATP